ncbi:MAG: response regulator [Deltaproteobacteria bacterium]|nr:response regulator [Deltaproteobacteria bacterium]
MNDNDWILLIDPFKNLVEVYQMILERENYFVEVASNMGEAFHRLSHRQYSIIITEYFPENENSGQIISWVKKNVPETYIFMVTSKGIDDQTYGHLFDLGLDDLVLKPYSPEKIIVHIKKGLERRAIIIQKKQLEKLMVLDPITGNIQKYIFNQVYFRKCLRQELKRAKRHHHPLSLLLLQIPPREKIGGNFEFFYAQLAKILKEYIREEDLLGRENGNLEIILPDTDETGSRAVLQRLTNLIQNHPLFQGDKVLGPVTKTIVFQTFTYPENLGISKFLKSVLEEIDREELK